MALLPDIVLKYNRVLLRPSDAQLFAEMAGSIDSGGGLRKRRRASDSVTTSDSGDALL